MKVAVYIQGQRLDLYEDESINVKQVTNDLKDISKLFTDYSQTFNVPVSPKNNVILKNWFNADIDNGFDARTRVEASIEVNTLTFKIGKIRLDGADIENNQPTQYKLTFFGDVIKIKDLIGEDKLSDLEWLDNFNHAYSGAVVKDGLINGLDTTVDSTTYEAAVIYPLISYQRQWFYDSDSSDDTSTDTLVNIADNGSVADHGIISGNLKPAIKLDMIIKAIENKYGFNFNSPFFDLGIWKEIYVNLNKTTETLNTGLSVVEETSGSYDPNFSMVGCEYIMTVTPASGFENTDYKIKLTVNGQVGHETSNFIQGTQTRGTGSDLPYDGEYDVKAEVITEQTFDFTATTAFRVYYFNSLTLQVEFDTVFSNTYSGQSIALNLNVRNELPDIKVYDFLTNIFKTFNLIATSDGQDIYIQDLQSWYEEGEIYDVTKFVDFKSEPIKRSNIFKNINFSFEDTEQILGEQFKLSNNQGYGNLEFKLTDENGDELQNVDGEVLEVESLFENPIFERLLDQDDNSETTIQYCPYFNREIKPISGGIFMFYGFRQSLGSYPINFINDGTEESISTFAFMPSHSYIIDQSTFNLNFNAEINEYTSIVMPNTIYKEFWEDYITDAFSIKRRLYEFKAIFPDYLLNQLKLNDRLIIKDRRYIINSISSNLVHREDTLELINDIFDMPLASDTLNTSLFERPFRLYNLNEKTYNIKYVGVDGSPIKTNDTGDGTGWITDVTTTTSGKVTNISFTLSENTTRANRSTEIEVTDSVNNPKFRITQKFDGELITNGTFDSDVSGWTALNSASVTWNSGQMNIANVSAGFGKAEQSITTEIGKDYTISFDFTRGFQNGSYRVGTSSNGTQLISATTLTSTQSVTNTFTATTTTTYVTVETNKASFGSGENTNWDNISVKRI